MGLSFIEFLKVVFLGIVEGITEWLPISSTGHMLLVDEFISLDASEQFKEMFFVIIQLGAILAVVLLFWKKMFPFQFKDKEKWRNAGEKPVAGDIIFFDWNDNDVADHVGIVAGYHLGRVFTIEGNASGDICKRKSYWVFSKYIMGYGTPESE